MEPERINIEDIRDGQVYRVEIRGHNDSQFDYTILGNNHEKDKIVGRVSNANALAEENGWHDGARFDLIYLDELVELLVPGTAGFGWECPRCEQDERQPKNDYICSMCRYGC